MDQWVRLHRKRPIKPLSNQKAKKMIMISWVNNISDSGMGYQRFSVDPLVALNAETKKRLNQLLADLLFVKGRTVLDIGVHAGLASIACIELGAKSVIGTDVDDTYFQPIAAWASGSPHSLSLEKVDFLNLTTKHTSDVLLILEVYHWLSHQGINSNEVATRLNMLAKQYIYIETPWDLTDPSVSRYRETSQHYYPAKLLNKLIEYGWSVEFIGLCDYFPIEYHRARFLLRRKGV